MFYSVLGIICAISVTIIFYLSMQVIKLRLKTALLSNENSQYLTQLAQLNAEKIANNTKIQELTVNLEVLKQSNQTFEQIKQDAFAAARESTLSLGQKLAEQLLSLHQLETKSSQEQSERQITNTTNNLKEEVQKLLQMLTILGKEVEKSNINVNNLKQNLLSPISAGQLAELTLSNVLHSSGLKPNLDFLIQPTISKQQQNYRPDAVVFLPNKNIMIIDAKTSKFFNDPFIEEKTLDNLTYTDAEKIQNNNLVSSIHNQLKILVSKEYHKVMQEHYNIPPQSADIITVMFLPTESAVEKLNRLDPEFLTKAWQHNVFPVGPTGLMNMLFLAKRQIKNHQQTHNYQLILGEVHKLLNSVDILIEHGNKLGTSLHHLTSSYDRFAASFNRNFTSKAHRLLDLGIHKTTKQKDLSNLLTRYKLIEINTQSFDNTNSMVTNNDSFLNEEQDVVCNLPE